MNIEQFKAWVATIAWGEGGRGGYGAHSQGDPKSDLFAHKDYPSFTFSTGIGPFQLDRGGHDGWDTWPTERKLDAAQAVQSVMEQHYTQFPDAGATLQTFANTSKWNAVSPGNVEALWSELTGTTWSQYSGGNVALNWSAIETSLAGNANDSSLYPYAQNVQDVGMKTWNIPASAGLYTDSGKSIVFTGAHPTWHITARTWGGTKLFQYYLTYDPTSNIEVWVLDNATASANALCYIFERECNGPDPEGYATTPGDTLASPALDVGTDTTPPSISITSPTTGASYLTRSSTISLGGTASDNVGVVNVTWSNPQTGGSGTASGTTSWTANNVSLATGPNVITVTAYDAAGNQSAATLTVTFTPTATSPAGTVISWGWEVIPYVPPGTRYQAIAAGGDFSLALKSDGTVVSWGYNVDGECNVPPNLTGVIAIAAGDHHSLALK
jgi:hypothetical protein